jgi:predicted ATPase
MTRGRENPPSSQAPGRVFVGRKPELGELRAGLDRAISGRGSVILLAGEPGIGKSELADRLGAEAATRGAEMLWGRSWEGEGAPPYWPWAQIIRAHVGEREGAALASVFGAAMPYLAQIVPELRDRLPDLPAPSPLDSEQARFRLFDAITTCLKRAAETRPLVLILDDVHWADKPSLLLLRFLAREMVESRLLVVAIYRDVEVSRGHPLAEVLPALRQERTVELSAAYGVGGRARKAGDVADRARKAVTSRIRETIARIAKEHPALGRHLDNAIRTGIFCSYSPDRSPNWSL